MPVNRRMRRVIIDRVRFELGMIRQTIGSVGRPVSSEPRDMAAFKRCRRFYLRYFRRHAARGVQYDLSVKSGRMHSKCL